MPLSEPEPVIAIGSGTDSGIVAVSAQTVELFDGSGAARGLPVSIPMADDARIRPNGTVTVVPRFDSESGLYRVGAEPAFRSWVTVRDAGWQTATTKSRLNAILFEHGKRIHQADWQWYVHDRWADETTAWDGSLTFEGSV